MPVAPFSPGTRLRSLLFAPANREDLVAKLPRSGPDGVILDLEDAVAPEAKADARRSVRSGALRLHEEHPELNLFVRVNAVHSEWFAADVEAVAGLPITGVVVPKIETRLHVELVDGALRRSGSANLAVMAGIESAAGIANAEEILVPPVALVYFGAEDFVADMGGLRTPENLEVLYARSRVVLAARVHGVVAVDQAVTAVSDEERFVADALQGQALGYRGKLCIHPAQVTWTHRVFSPSPDAVERARRLLRAYEEAIATGVTAIAFEGEMVDEPVARQARMVLAMADDARS
jgi:citrate lyase subunit beta/citryl-CoA lyase